MVSWFDSSTITTSLNEPTGTFTFWPTLYTNAWSVYSTDGAQPSDQSVPSLKFFFMMMPAWPSLQPWIQPVCFSNLPLLYSSGYSPSSQTSPLLSWARNMISASSISLSTKSRSQQTTVFTPAISFTRSVTIHDVECASSSPSSSTAYPDHTNFVPGFSEYHSLLMTVG